MGHLKLLHPDESTAADSRSGAERERISGVTFRIAPRLLEHKASGARMVFVVLAGTGAALLAGLFAAVVAIHNSNQDDSEPEPRSAPAATTTPNTIEVDIQ